ncbi:MAG TPA: hypothetical protein VMY88_02365 [Acidimicrobiales bacterium]|nr:hypothetical protein [Acidimicrobiales bacterium]
MLRRIFWFAVGIGFGAGLSWWATRALRRTAEKYAPDRVAGELSKSLGRFGADLKAAVGEGRSAMRAREEELRVANPLKGGLTGS